MKFQMLIIFKAFSFVVSNKSFEIVKTWKLLQNFHKESTNYNLSCLLFKATQQCCSIIHYNKSKNKHSFWYLNFCEGSCVTVLLLCILLFYFARNCWFRPGAESLPKDNSNLGRGSMEQQDLIHMDGLIVPVSRPRYDLN